MNPAFSTVGRNLSLGSLGGAFSFHLGLPWLDNRDDAGWHGCGMTRDKGLDKDKVADMPFGPEARGSFQGSIQTRYSGMQ